MTRERFNEYVHLQSRKLYGFAFRILHNQQEAEDAVQEIFIKLWKLGDKLEEYSSIDALATTMIRNHCIDLIRRERRTECIEDKGRENAINMFPSPQEILENKESDEIIKDIIKNLEEKYRVVIELREIEELSYEEIAVRTGQNINTLRVTLSRARGLIREKYKKYNHERRRTEQAS